MTWADAIPNLLIGLREGLEAGLVVSILLAALRKTNVSAPDGRRISSSAIWLGVLGAVTVAGSFAAVLTYSTNVLSSAAQEAVGGVLSVLAVGLVTGMVFWMRRSARTLSAQLRGDVSRAALVGAGALTLTAFLAVGREGLETTLFLWTAVKASGSTVAPLLGAAVGLAAAIVLCCLLYRQAVRIDLGKFFNRTAIALIVIAAGVLAYGLGDLQDAGLLAGQRWVAFDLTAHVDPNTWWVSIVSGATELAPRMTVLQVVAYVGYLAVVVPAFVRAGKAVPPPPASIADEGPRGGRWERWTGRHIGPVAAVLVLVPALVAGLVIAVLPASSASAMTAVTVTGSGCADEWSAGHTGRQTFAVDNKSDNAGEINLDNAGGAVVAEIETIGPATTADMTATLGRGQYAFVCLMSSGTTRGKPVQVSGTGKTTTAPVTPVTPAELTGPNKQYTRYAAGELDAVISRVRTLRAAIASDHRAAARADWLLAQQDWERVGASYDSFGSRGLAVDGLPDGLPGGVRSPHFTGLHRIEYGLYHGQRAAQLDPVVDKLTAQLRMVRRDLGTEAEAGDPTNLPLRVHEVLEDALRDHLSGIDDEGSGMAYALTYADTQVTRVVLHDVAPLIAIRLPGLVPKITRQLDTLQGALLATRRHGQWRSISSVSLVSRQRVDAAIGALLQSLSLEPDLLEVPPKH